MRTIAYTISSLLLLSIGTLGQAQQFEDAASMEFGSFDFTPTVDISLLYDDNVIRENENTIESWSRRIAPQLNLFTTYGASDLSITYRLVNEDYFSSSADNYTDHFFSVASSIELNARNRLRLGVDFDDTHDARGTNFSIGLGPLLSEPDQFKQSTFNLLYSYGAFNADGRLDFSLNISDQNYDINTPIYRARDRKFSTIGATFYYRVGATTDMTFDVERRYVDYKFAINPVNSLDSYQNSFLVGIDWEATAKTSGFAKIGYQSRKFESSLRDDFNGVDWALGVLWEPSSYSEFELTTRADTNETNGQGNFIRSNVHSAAWRHEWLERLRTGIRVSFINDRYEGQLIDNSFIRSDDNMRFQASIYYQFRRWVNLELGYVYDERDSNRDIIDFDRNRFIINALVTL